MNFTAQSIPGREAAWRLTLPATIALALAWTAPHAAAQQLPCREGLDEPERSICTALGREAQWALSERAMAALAHLTPERRPPVAADIGNWAETLALACDRTAVAPAAPSSMPLAKFQPECRGFLADSLSAYLETQTRHAAVRYRWQATRGDALETLVLSVTPLLGDAGHGGLARLQRAIEREAARYVKDNIDADTAPPGAARLPPCCAQFIEVRAQAVWLGPELVSIELARRNRTRDGQETGFRYVTLYDPRRHEEIETFAELFDQAKALTDTVIEILVARFATRRDVRDYAYFTLNNLQNFVADLKRWRLEPEGVTLLFDAGDIAPQTVGAIDEPIPYAAIMPFIRKDGALGRALGMQ